MCSMIIFKSEITAQKLGFDSSTHAGLIGLSKRSYWLGYSAFLLGKSVASGKNIFNRSAFQLGWQDAARRSIHKR